MSPFFIGRTQNCQKGRFWGFVVGFLSFLLVLFLLLLVSYGGCVFAAAVVVVVATVVDAVVKISEK